MRLKWIDLLRNHNQLNDKTELFIDSILIRFCINFMEKVNFFIIFILIFKKIKIEIFIFRILDQYLSQLILIYLSNVIKLPYFLFLIGQLY